MIKLLFIHNQLVCGGAEQALFDLIALLDKTIFDITVLVQYDGGIWENKFRQAGMRVISIWDCQINSHNPLIKFHNNLKRIKIEKALKNDGEGLLNICLHDKFDIIVSYNGSTLSKMYFNRNAKTVKYIHGDIATNTEFCKNTLRILDSLHRFDRIICVSNTAKTSFESIIKITKGVVRHYNPLDSEKVKKMARQKIDLLKDLPIICAIGRLSQEKGYDRLIKIHKNLIREGIFHRLVIVGDGPERDNLQQLIDSKHVEDTVLMVGYKENPYPYILNSKFLVCSSYTEGLPVIAMESLALGVPIISSAPSVKEILGNEECGLITENDDRSLEEGIRKTLLDEIFYRKLKEGAERRSSFFDGKRMVKEIEHEFLSLLKED